MYFCCGGAVALRSEVHDLTSTREHRDESAHQAQRRLLGLWAQRMSRPLADLPRAEFRYVRNSAGRITALPMVDREVGAQVLAVTDS